MSLRCEKHGEVEATICKLYADWTNPSCPLCQEERQTVEAAEEAERRLRDEQRHRAAMVERSLKQSGIPSRFASKTFDQYQPDQPSAARIKAACVEYANEFPDRLARGVSLTLCGNTGNGKTHLACAIARHVITVHARSAVYMTVGEAFRSVKATFSKSSARTEQEALDALRQPDLLILDEIGVQYGSESEKNILFEIINERYEAMKPTIIISNLAAPALTEYVGERVIDRLKENGGKLAVFDWESSRGKRVA